MHLRIFVTSAVALGVLADCHRPAPESKAANPPAERTVFTDSLLHAEKCLSPKQGEDWRRVCTPRDQGVRVGPKPRERP